MQTFNHFATGNYANQWNPNGVTYDHQWSLSPVEVGYVTYTGDTTGFPEQLGKQNLTTQMVGYGGHNITVGQGSFFSEKYTSSRLWNRYEATGSFQTGFSLESIVPDVVPDLDTLEVCSTALKSKIYNVQSGTQSGVFLGEIKQTLSLIKNPLKQASKSFNSLDSILTKMTKKYRKKRNKQFINAWTGQYLEFAFGIQPLFSDIESHIKRINEILNKKQYTQVDARETATENLPTLLQNGMTLDSQMRYNTQLVRSVRESSRGRALVVNFPSGVSFNPKYFGFRFADFVPTVYELIPFSFLVDYFSNLNELVNSTFYETESVVFGYVTRERITEGIVHYSDFASNVSNPTAYGGSSPMRVRKRDVVRQDIAKIPDSIQLSLPGTRQIINIAALLLNTTKNIK